MYVWLVGWAHIAKRVGSKGKGIAVVVVRVCVLGWDGC